ncbi:MAG TPA: DNRLRE domain-containing protein, partial [Acidobacteriota bacterium]
MRIQGWFVRGLLAGLLGAEPVAADQVQIPAQKDNTLYQDAGGALSNGAGGYLFCGQTQAFGTRRGLIAFDVAGSIPPGSTIQNAVLTLYMSRTISGPQPVGLHPVLADWGEGTSDATGPEGDGAPAEPGDATWLHTFFATDFWSAAGGDFAAQTSAVQSVDGEAAYSWGSTAEMVADVQSWLDNPAGNFGWLLLGDEAVMPSAKRFNSRQHADGATQPLLTVDFLPPIAVELLEF